MPNLDLQIILMYMRVITFGLQLMLLNLQQQEMLLLERFMVQRRRRRVVWVKPWLQRRHELGLSETLLEELAVEDAQTYKRLLGVDVPFFERLLGRIENRITKQDTQMRLALPPKLRLQVFLRHLRSGMSRGENDSSSTPL